MNNRAPEVQLPVYVKIASILLSLVIVIYGLYALQEVLIPLVFAVLLSVLLYPLSRRLERWHIPRIWAIIICLIVAIAALVGLFYLIMLQIGNFTQEAPKIIIRGNELLDKVQTYADEHFNIDRQRQLSGFRRYFNTLLQESGTIITNTLLATTNTLATISLMPLFIFFFLLYRDFFKSFFYRAFSEARRTKIDTVFYRIYMVVRDYLAGLVLVILIVGMLNTVGLLILRVDYAVFFGFFGALLILIPYFGIALGSLLPALFSLVTQDNLLIPLGIVGVFLFVQVLEGNFITPYIVGSKVSINPLAAIIVLILWGQLWGVAGLILALPLTAIIKVLFDSVEELKPYGYLLGEAERPRPPIRNLEELRKKLPQRFRKIGDVDVKS